MSIGKNIAALRRKKGLTQEKLGEALGVTNQAVSKWEGEITMPDIMLLPQIAKVLGVTIEDLYKDDISSLLNDCGGNDSDTIEKEARQNSDGTKDCSDNENACEGEDNRVLQITVDGEDDDVKITLPVGMLKVLSHGFTSDGDGEKNSGLGATMKILEDKDFLGRFVDIDAEGYHITVGINPDKNKND